LELIRRGYEVYVADVGDLEIDFVAQKEGVRDYFQVAYSVVDKKTYQREVAPFFQIKDNYRKILLTMDEGSYNDQGIEQINIVDWLLETSLL
jgi:predicted AAA+ superfamily ATPase